MKSLRTLYLLAVCCLAVTACTGQLFKNYGRIDASTAATAAFERYEVNPNYRYYISGSDFHPNALIGLDRKHRIDPRTMWREVEMTPGRMKAIVDQMKVRAAQYFDQQIGFEMRDPEGKQIGVWYSILYAATFVRMNDDGTAWINTPDPDTYKELDRDGGDKDQ